MTAVPSHDYPQKDDFPEKVTRESERRTILRAKSAAEVIPPHNGALPMIRDVRYLCTRYIFYDREQCY